MTAATHPLQVLLLALFGILGSLLATATGVVSLPEADAVPAVFRSSADLFGENDREVGA